MDEGDKLGAVEAYMLARIMPQPGATTAMAALFDDYAAWWRVRGAGARVLDVGVA